MSKLVVDRYRLWFADVLDARAVLSVPRALWVIAAAVVIGAVTPAQEPGQRVIQGVVTDTSGRAVPRVQVQFGTRRTVTDDSGHFRIRGGSAGRLTLRRIGYVPFTIGLEGVPDSLLRITLAELPQTLSTQVVTAERDARSRKLDLHGFYQRMRDVERGINHGYFITQEEIEERRGARNATDLLHNVPAVRLLRRLTYTVPMGVDGCGMAVYLDGRRLNPLTTSTSMLTAWERGRGSQGNGGTAELDNLASPTDIAGIEVYPRAVGAPPQYQSLNGSCGVILVWTK
jgi:hypothetical protein